MKGFYILTAMLLLVALLGYLALRPTDRDLRRSHDQLMKAMTQLEDTLAGLHPSLVFLRQQKRRTFKLDGEYELLRKKASELRMQLNAALFNIEHLNDKTRPVTEETLAELGQSMNKQLAAGTAFGTKVKMLERFVKEAFPLLAEIEALQARMNRLAGERTLTADLAKDVESYNHLCGQIENWASQAMTSVHSDLEQGRILSGTVLNEASNLKPTLEAFVESLEKDRPTGE